MVGFMSVSPARVALEASIAMGALPLVMNRTEPAGYWHPNVSNPYHFISNHKSMYIYGLNIREVV